MKLQRKKNAGRTFPRYAWRAGVILTLLMVLAEVGYLTAQSLQPNSPDLMRLAIRGDAYLINSGLFLALRESALIPLFGIAILAFVLLSLGHFFKFGPKDMTAKDEADLIEWWSMGMRVVHGLMAVVFLILMITGLMLTFGRYLGGPGVFLRQTHDITGFLFIPLLVIMVVAWFREALPKSYDLEWFKHFGGYMGYKGKLTSGKFNAGQKVWFWIMALCGVLLSFSGLILFFGAGEIESMRLQVVLHFFAAVPIILMFLVHLYMTTMGTKGTFMGMIHGRFSKTAAENYHSEASTLKALAESK